MSRYDWHLRNIRRDNFADFAELDDACSEARKTLKRKSATVDEVRTASLILLMAVRTLRSWHSARCAEIREMSHIINRKEIT